MLEDVSKLGEPDLFVNNVSSSRVNIVPEKYRINISNTSKLNALWISRGYFQSIGITPTEFMDDPIEVEKKANLYCLSDKTPIGKFFKEYKNDRLGLLRKFDNPTENKDLYDALNSTYQIPYGTDRAVNAIATLISNKNEKTQLEKELMIYNACVTSRIAETINGFISGLGSKEIKTTNIVNFLVTPDEEFNILNFCAQKEEVIDPNTLDFYGPYDTSVAMEKTGAKTCIDRLIELNKDDLYNKNELKNVNLYFKDRIQEARVSLTKNDKQILKYLANNKELTETIKTTFNAEKTVESINKDGIDKENVEDVVKSYAEIKKSYDSRNFFAKIFYSDVRKQKSLMNSIKEKMIEKDIPMDAVDEYVASHNADLNELDSLNAIKQSVEPVNPFKEQTKLKIVINDEELENELNNQTDLDKSFIIEKDELEREI